MVPRRGRRGGVNRSQFIREYLKQHPEAKHKDVEQAWKEAGHEDPITSTLFYQIKNQNKNKAESREAEVNEHEEEQEHEEVATPPRNGRRTRSVAPAPSSPAVHYQQPAVPQYTPASSVATHASGRKRGGDNYKEYEQLELELDNLVVLAEQMGDPHLINELRAARRHVSARLHELG